MLCPPVHVLYSQRPPVSSLSPFGQLKVVGGKSRLPFHIFRPQILHCPSCAPLCTDLWGNRNAPSLAMGIWRNVSSPGLTFPTLHSGMRIQHLLCSCHRPKRKKAMLCERRSISKRSTSEDEGPESHPAKSRASGWSWT